MEQYIIAFSSVTYANAGMAVLQNAGYPSRLIRLEASRTRNGCGFGVLTSGSRYKIRQLLRNAGVHYSDIFPAEADERR